MINIKPFKQTDDSRCGPACIKMVLDYYGIEATEDEICKRCEWAYELGCTNKKMIEAINSYGLRCTEFRNTSLTFLGNILRLLRAPLIVDWFSPGVDLKLSDMPNGHSSVVVDIDDTYIHLMDPELGGLRSILRGEFERVWFDWVSTPTIESCDDLVLRHAILVYR